MNVYFIPVPAKQEVSFSGLAHSAHSLLRIISLRERGALLRQTNESVNLQPHGPFLLPRECAGNITLSEGAKVST